jgi:hypothetical protein
MGVVIIMKEIAFRVFSGLALGLTLSLAPGMAAFADTLQPVETPFDADMTMISEGQTVTGHIWFNDGLERRRMDIGDQGMTIIVRPDKDAVFMMPDDAPMAMEMPMSPEFRYVNGGLLKGIDLDPQGSESIAGEDTTKYAFDGTTILDEPMSGVLWITNDGIVMKLEGEAQIKGQASDVLMFLENVSRDTPAPDLFEIDPGIQIMKMN